MAFWQPICLDRRAQLLSVGMAEGAELPGLHGEGRPVGRVAATEAGPTTPYTPLAA